MGVVNSLSCRELSPLFVLLLLFWGPLGFPLTRQRIYFFAGVLIPAKLLNQPPCLVGVVLGRKLGTCSGVLFVDLVGCCV